MKKVSIFVAGSFLMIAAASAQAPNTPAGVKKEGMKDMRKDIRTERADKRTRAADVKEGHYKAANAENKQVQADKRNVHSEQHALKSEGVKHPIIKADRQIKAQNEAK